MPTNYFALDLKNDPALIAQYEDWHRPEKIWPDIVDALVASGVEDLEIFRAGNRLVMVLRVADDFAAGDKAATDAANSREQAWQELMWKFQQPLPFAAPGEKWVPMEAIFSLKQTLAVRIP